MKAKELLALSDYAIKATQTIICRQPPIESLAYYQTVFNLKNMLSAYGIDGFQSNGQDSEMKNFLNYLKKPDAVYLQALEFSELLIDLSKKLCLESQKRRLFWFTNDKLFAMAIKSRNLAFSIKHLLIDSCIVHGQDMES